MAKIILNMPTVAAVEEPTVAPDSPFAAPILAPIISKIMDMAYKGVVNKDGGFRISPDPDWKALRTDKGCYTIEHMGGSNKYNLGLSLLTQPGIIVIKDAGINSFSVETRIDGELVDLDFSFSLNLTVMAG